LFATMPLSGTLAYRYAAAREPASGRSPGGELAGLIRPYSDWPEPIAELLPAAAPDTVVRSGVHYLDTALPAYHAGKVAIVGDAAHAMPPDLGQGACQAIEDAVTLGHEVSHGSGLPAYTAARLTRTRMVLDTSVAVSRLALATNALVRRLMGMRGPRCAVPARPSTGRAGVLLAAAAVALG
jgi:2-polyprenyl-6-methoxyphenol hydroxylase-like FAD-dependent oxidoreductase